MKINSPYKWRSVFPKLVLILARYFIAIMMEQYQRWTTWSFNNILWWYKLVELNEEKTANKQQKLSTPIPIFFCMKAYHFII
jgi:hypothetical protein